MMSTRPPRWCRLALLAVLLVLPAAAAIPQAEVSTKALRCGLVQSEGCASWATLVEGAGHDQPHKMVQDPAGARLFVLAHAFNTSVNSGEMAVEAFDAATGSRLWRTSYHEADDDQDSHNDNGTQTGRLVVSPDGQWVYATVGLTNAFSSQPHWVALALDAATGDIAWQAIFHDAGSGNIAISPDGTTLYAAGSTYLQSTDFRTLALDTRDGAVRWIAPFDGHGLTNDIYAGWSFDAPSGLAFDAEGGRLYVVGVSANVTRPHLDQVMMAYDAHTGQELWHTRMTSLDAGATQARSVIPYAIALSPDASSVYVVGTEGLRAYDAATGASQWTPRSVYRCVLHDSACSLEVHPDGTAVYIRTRHELVAYAAHDGELKWRLPAAVPQGGSWKAAIDLAPDGSTLYVLSVGPKSHLADAPDNRATALEAYDTDQGILLWRIARQDGQWSIPRGVLVSPDGLYVYALSVFDETDAPHTDYSLVAYPTNIGLRADQSPTRPIL